MCISYQATKAPELKSRFDAHIDENLTWPDEVWQDYSAPIIRANEAGSRVALVGSYGMVPKRHIPPKIRMTTMNARSETVGTVRSYAPAWRASQLCLVPMHSFYEPNWETGKHIRYRIGMADGSPFAVAGLWRAWTEPDGSTSHSFTQLTINSDEHELMRHFHKPDDEKRSLVIVPESAWDDWLNCRDPEQARSFLTLYPAGLMAAEPAPPPPPKKKAVDQLEL